MLLYSKAYGSDYLSQVIYATGANPVGLSVVDVNNDNKPDITITDYGAHNIRVHFNTGNGTFVTPTIYPAGVSPLFKSCRC